MTSSILRMKAAVYDTNRTKQPARKKACGNRYADWKERLSERHPGLVFALTLVLAPILSILTVAGATTALVLPFAMLFGWL